MSDNIELNNSGQVSSWEVYYERLGFLLRRCHQASISQFMEECAEYDLTPTQFGVLVSLQLTPDMDQIGVARAIGLDRSTAGSVVERLVNRGLIERIVNAKDRRRRSLKLTQKGLGIVQAAEPASYLAQKKLVQGLNKQEVETLISLLSRLMETTHQQNRVVVQSPVLDSKCPEAEKSVKEPALTD